MAKSTKGQRELYGFLLGEDLVKKLSDDQINLVSLYYQSLSEKEKNKINESIETGKSHDLLEMAQSLLEEGKQSKKPKPKAKKTTVKSSTNKKTSSAKPKGKKTTLDSIEVDERILKLLGLEDVFDIDGDYYLTLLKERMESARMTKSKIPREDDELLVDEFKKVKKEIDKDKRYNIKKKKISAQKFVQLNPRKILNASKQQYLLAGKIDIKEDTQKIKKEKKDPLLLNVIAIRKSVDNIVSLIGAENKILSDGYNKERKRKERERREKRESNLEKIKKSGIAAIKSVIAPVQDILDKIINFLTWVVLGRAVIKFLNWAGDPKNKSKLEAIGNLLKTWWPAVLGAFLLFTTPLGKFIRVVVGTVTKITFQLLKRGIPALRRFLSDRNKQRRKVTTSQRTKPGRFKGGRGGLIGTLALLGAEAATPFLSEKVGELYSNLKIGDAGLSNEDLLKEYQREKSSIEKKTSGPLGGFLEQRTDYSRLEGLEQELGRRGIAYKGGGQIFNGVVSEDDGIPFSGAGEDTQAFPVMGGGVAVLKPGELVLNEEQQRKMYLDTGTDPRSYVADARPKSVYGKMMGYNTGGVIGGGRSLDPWMQRFVTSQMIQAQQRNDMRELKRLQNMYGDLIKPGTMPLPGVQGGGFLGNLKNFVGGIGNIFTGQKASATASKPKVPSWHGPAPLPDYKSKEAQALLKTIRTAEHYASTKNPYDTLFGGGTAPVSQMTVKEVINMYDTKKLPARFGGGPANYGTGSGAAGAYQFMPFTLEDLIRRGAVKPNQIMTPDLQDRLGWYLASNVRGLSVSGLKKQGLTQGFMDKIAPEWASFPYSPKGGASYYDQPVKSSKFLSGIYQQSLPKKKGGGYLVKENSGMDIPGAGADRQMLLGQPGEYMLPVDFVNAVGVPAIDKLVAYFDSNSNPAKLNKNVNRIIPGPRTRKPNRTQVLPPINQGSLGKDSSQKAGSEVPSFSMISPGSLQVRSQQMSLYGIVG